MAVSGIARVAARDAVRVFPVIGRGARRLVEDLSTGERIVLAASPRHAHLLLVAGTTRAADRPDLQRLHDQLPHPRATLWWRADPDPAFGPATELDRSDPIEAIVQVHRDLLTGKRPSDEDLLADEPPAPWQGLGDHGQGGEGMMGGKPYGRAMPMTDDDLRDGLALDAYSASVGPFAPMLPPGLLLELTLQGDLLQSVDVVRAPFEQEESPSTTAALRYVARLLAALGLPTAAIRFLKAARRSAAGGALDLTPLRRLLRWSGARRAIPKGLGLTAGGDVRSRFDEWWQRICHADHRSAEPGDDRIEHPNLGGLLVGLEWHEAIIVLNSFEPHTLAALCHVPSGRE